MEFLDTILGAAVACLAYGVGVRRERSRKPTQKGAVCGCGHHRSFHKDDGKCGHLNHNRMPDCGCQQYHGPKTLDDLIAED